MTAKTYHCERCGEIMNDIVRLPVFLELNAKSLLFSEKPVSPPEDSQGGFPFCSTCAPKVIKNGGKLEDKVK